MDPIQNLRIHFYGTQGSGSTFPTREERQEYRQHLDQDLLTCVFEDLKGRGKALTVEDILGGPMSLDTIRAYRSQFNLTERRVYGGLTTCVLLETSDGYDIVLDCGSGFRNCALDLQTKWADRPERNLYVLGSHSHADHTEGFDQAAVCFDPRNTIHVFGNRQFLHALDSKLGIFSNQVSSAVKGVHTPISYDIMPANFESTAIIGANTGNSGRASSHSFENGFVQNTHAASEPIVLGDTRITAFAVEHPAPCLAYRIEYRGKVFVFCTDHELRHAGDDSELLAKSVAAEERLIEYSQEADVLYRDGQYLRAEYDGLMGVGDSSPVPRVGWGHSCIEDVVEMAEHAKVKRLYIGHHDPNRAWGERNSIDESLARRSYASLEHAELARTETSIDL